MKRKDTVTSLRGKEAKSLEKMRQDEEAEIRKIMIGETASKDTTALRKHRKIVARILTILNEKTK